MPLSDRAYIPDDQVVQGGAVCAKCGEYFDRKWYYLHAGACDANIKESSIQHEPQGYTSIEVLGDVS